MDKKDKTLEIFENAPVPKAVLNNIVPSIISMLMVLLYNLADTFFIKIPHFFAQKVAERNGAAVRVGQGEMGRLVACFEHSMFLRLC